MEFNKHQIAASSTPISPAILVDGASDSSSIKCLGARGTQGGEDVA